MRSAPCTATLRAYLAGRVGSVVTRAELEQATGASWAAIRSAMSRLRSNNEFVIAQPRAYTSTWRIQKLTPR